MKASDQVVIEIGHLLRNSNETVIATHVNPDGDAMGSALALHILLKNMGRKSTVITPNEYPDFLHWLPENDSVIRYTKNKKEAKAIINQAGLIVCVDFNSSDRMGFLEKTVVTSAACKVMIDHHPHPSDFAKYVISNTAACSTAELIYDLACTLGEKAHIDKATAECLFTGIMTDTGSFSYSTNNPDTFRTVADLLSLGVDKDQIYCNVYDNFSEHRMRLMGHCLDTKMIILKDYHTAYFAITKEDQEKYKFSSGDSEGFVNLPLRIKGIKFSAFFMEKDNMIKISFRSKGSFAVNEFSAKYFEGGGHRNAAGGQLTLSLQETLDKFLRVLPEYAVELVNSSL